MSKNILLNGTRLGYPFSPPLISCLSLFQRKILVFPARVKMVEAVSSIQKIKPVIDVAVNLVIAGINVKVTNQSINATFISFSLLLLV